jgi:hypothetical protein
MAKTPANPSLSLVSAGSTRSAPPRTLGPDGTALWNRVMAEYRIEDAGGIELLAQACAALDRAEALAAAIAEDGAVIRTPSGPKSHPACKDELACRAFVARTLERIGSQRASPLLFSAALEPGDVTERISGQTARDVEHRTDNIRTNDGTSFQKKNPGQRELTGLSQTPQFRRGFRRSSREPQLLPINSLRGRFADNPPQL